MNEKKSAISVGWLVGWLVGYFGLNGPLRQYFSLYRAVSQREGKRQFFSLYRAVSQREGKKEEKK